MRTDRCMQRENIAVNRKMRREEKALKHAWLLPHRPCPGPHELVSEGSIIFDQHQYLLHSYPPFTIINDEK